MDVPEVEVEEALERCEDGALLIDVREPDEYTEVHAVGARLIPLAEVGEHADDLPTDAPVYVICRSGARSASAAELLRSRGVDAVNVFGGTLAWQDAGLPTATGPEEG